MKIESKHSPIKFCILTTQRSGSLWLIDLMDSHPEIKAFKELFRIKKPNNIWSDQNLPDFMSFYEFQRTHLGIRPFKTFNYLKSIIDDYPISYHAIGFKLMYNQVMVHPELLPKLVSDRYQIIHLVRNNYLDTVLSKINAKQKRIVHPTADIKVSANHLDPKALLRELNQQDWTVKTARKLLQALPNPSIEVTYESLCLDKEKVLNEITQFLGISTDQITYQSELKKINKGTYRDKISNYEEIEKVLSGTKFERFLSNEIKVNS